MEGDDITVNFEGEKYFSLDDKEYSYKGGFSDKKHDTFHGYGELSQVLKDSNNNEYLQTVYQGNYDNGNWSNGTAYNFSLEGILTEICEGAWTNGLLNGEGKIHQDGVILEGTFKNGVLHGEGKIIENGFI